MLYCCSSTAVLLGKSCFFVKQSGVPCSIHCVLRPFPFPVSYPSSIPIAKRLTAGPQKATETRLWVPTQYCLLNSLNITFDWNGFSKIRFKIPFLHSCLLSFLRNEIISKSKQGKVGIYQMFCSEEWEFQVIARRQRFSHHQYIRLTHQLWNLD